MVNVTALQCIVSLICAEPCVMSTSCWCLECYIMLVDQWNFTRRLAVYARLRASFLTHINSQHI